MTLNQALARMRRLLKDESYSSRQGTLYTQEEMTAALNAAEMMFFNYALARNLRRVLERLVRVWEIDPNQTTFPTNYAHGFSAQARVAGRKLFAQLYIGREAEAYLDTEHYAVFLIGNEIFHSALPATRYELNYYAYPSGFSLLTPNTNNADFAEESYEIIVLLAATLTGLRDTVHAREGGYLRAITLESLLVR